MLRNWLRIHETYLMRYFFIKIYCGTCSSLHDSSLKFFSVFNYNIIPQNNVLYCGEYLPTIAISLKFLSNLLSCSWSVSNRFISWVESYYFFCYAMFSSLSVFFLHFLDHLSYGKFYKFMGIILGVFLFRIRFYIPNNEIFNTILLLLSW